MASLAASYDVETRQRRAVKQSLFWFAVIIALTYAFAYVWQLYIGPFKQFHKKRITDYEKALVTLRTDTCIDPVIRAQLEGYNLCERARFDSEQSPAMLAFHDLMETLRFCDKGVCIIFGFNVTDSLWTLFRIALVAGVILYALSIIGLVSIRHGQSVGQYSMPMTMPPEYMAMLASKQFEYHQSTMAAAHKPPPSSRQELLHKND